MNELNKYRAVASRCRNYAVDELDGDEAADAIEMLLKVIDVQNQTIAELRQMYFDAVVPKFDETMTN